MKPTPEEFRELARQRPSTLLSEFWHFLRTDRAWWLFPFLAALAALAAIVALTTSGAAPFIYTLI